MGSPHSSLRTLTNLKSNRRCAELGITLDQGLLLSREGLRRCTLVSILDVVPHWRWRRRRWRRRWLGLQDRHARGYPINRYTQSLDSRINTWDLLLQPLHRSQEVVDVGGEL